jgi:predicted nucleotidyltransferase
MSKDTQSQIDRQGFTAEAVAAVKKYLTERDDIAFAYLFGSRAKEISSPLSDVDIAVYLTQGPLSDKRLTILGDLIDILHRDDVDLVLLNTASEGLKARIVKNRVILADNIPFTRHRFESHTLRVYMDFSKFENRILEHRYLHG